MVRNMKPIELMELLATCPPEMEIVMEGSKTRTLTGLEIWKGCILLKRGKAVD